MGKDGPTVVFPFFLVVRLLSAFFSFSFILVFRYFFSSLNGVFVVILFSRFAFDFFRQTVLNWRKMARPSPQLENVMFLAMVLKVGSPPHVALCRWVSTTTVRLKSTTRWPWTLSTRQGGPVHLCIKPLISTFLTPMQHTPCPCRSFILERYKLYGHKTTTQRHYMGMR